MVLDFDVKTFLQNLRATKPPYECPVTNCGKIYKSFGGIQFHLYNYDHENPTSTSQHSPTMAKIRKKKGKWHPRQNRRSPSPAHLSSQSSQDNPRLPEAQKLVEVDLDGHVHQLNVCEPLDIVFYDGPVEEVKSETSTKVEVKPEKFNKVQKSASSSKNRKDAAASKDTKLPEATFRVLPDYDAPDAPPLPNAYYRFIEKSLDELDEDVEYDMDEEDCAWLEIMNNRRKSENVPEISADTFELMMDRLEKESYFQSQTTGKDPNPSIDEDAVCCICNDGECQNSNAILFCDMCNLAVHQECYGVPYIPEGQWLCRRCLQSPSRAVDCVLCPNKGGAFKQTDDGRWAHVVCALWIPEVCFANTVFLEPLDSIENIPPARWKLTCYICKQRSVGACIQCHKANCYTAFHVTCAQQAGLHMKMEAVRESGINGTSYNVRKTAYCDVHMPADVDNYDEETGRTDSFKKAKAKAKSREKMRRARKILAEKRCALPVVSLPTIPSDRLTKIANMVSMPKKQPFLERLVAYWTLKRQSRNGVPLLRRLQTQQSRRDVVFDKDSGSLAEQLKYWQRLRQDLEKARLLVELIRKREKLKREYIKAHQSVTEMRLQPLNFKLHEVIEQLKEKDTGQIFDKPVDLEEVPDYLDYIKHPMDFETMSKKVNSYQYDSFESFESDFNLIIRNCMMYNSKETVFYKAAVKLRDQGGSILRDSRVQIDLTGFDFESGLLVNQEDDEKPGSPIKTDMESASLEEKLKILTSQLDATSKIKHGVTRSRRAKQLRLEIMKVRRKIALQASLDHRKKKKKLRGSDTPKNNQNSSQGEISAQNTAKNKIKKVYDSMNSDSDFTEAPLYPKRLTRAAQNDLTDTKDMEDFLSSPSPPRALPSQAAKGSKVNNTPPKVRRPVGRPPTKSLKLLRKPSPPPPSLDKPNEKSSSPPTLVSASTPPERSKPHRAASLMQSSSLKGISPPILKPQVPILDHSGASGNEDSVAKDSEPISPVCSTTRARFHRSSQSSMAKVVASDEGDETMDDSATDNETRTRSTRAQTRSRSESDAVSPGRKGLRKNRSSTTTEAETISNSSSSPSKKRATSVSSAPGGSMNPFLETSLPQTDSFKVYRSNTQNHGSDSDDNNTETSSESVRSSSMSSDESSSDDESNTEESPKKSPSKEVSISSPQTKPTTSTLTSEWNAEEQQHLIPLQALDLVWAKCRGYPWYPALIISPDMPNSGYVHNGVPIPVPPKEVLALKSNYEDNVFLVLFFDTKRTWQWLPRDKLAPLGVDSALDKARLVESKKAAERKAVKKAFENAILHRCRVTGESTSMSGESGND